MQLGAVGVLIALVGTVLAFWRFPVIGYWIGAVGLALVFVGVAFHFALNWCEIFRVHRYAAVRRYV